MIDTILILGGARSGKSDYAEKLAGELGERVLYIATAEAKDEEMKIKIEAHQRARPATWRTLEASAQIGRAVAALDHKPDVLLVDCVTLLVSNILLKWESEPPATVEAAVQAEITELVETRAKLDVPLVIVSNEVGLGVVPPYSLGRIYRDILGRANQRLAAVSDRVYFMVAGLPMVVKDGN